MILGSEKQHHPRRYMTNHSGNVVFIFTCCGEQRTFASRSARDKIAVNHEAEYNATHQLRKMGDGRSTG